MKHTYTAPQVKEVNLWIENDAMITGSDENLIAPAVEDDEFDM